MPDQTRCGTPFDLALACHGVWGSLHSRTNLRTAGLYSAAQLTIMARASKRARLGNLGESQVSDGAASLRRHAIVAPKQRQ